MDDSLSMKDMGFTDLKFPLKTHMCLIYNSEEERKKIIAKFIKAGVDKKERVHYLADKVTKSQIKEWLAEMGIKMDAEEQPKNFSVHDAEEVYCSGGYFSPDKMLDALKQMHEQTSSEGFCCLRASGEMTWALKGYPGSEKLIEYECRLNELVETHPLLALCQYDANKFDGKTIFEVLQVHPYMIVKGQILTNPYYIKPSEFLKRFKK